MNNKILNDFVEGTWDKSIVPTLKKYLAVPDQPPAFDAEWRTNGYTDQALEWAETHGLPLFEMRAGSKDARVVPSTKLAQKLLKVGAKAL